MPFGPLLMFLQFSVLSPEGGVREYFVEGMTYAPRGQITSTDGKGVSPDLLAGPVQRLAEISARCNDAKIVYDEV